MKKTLTTIVIFISCHAFAMDADQLKEQAMKACETTLESTPEDMKDKSIKLCKCKVEKTDYEALILAQETGDTSKVTADELRITEECSKEIL